MGEETTWFDLLPGVPNLVEFSRQYLGRRAAVATFPTVFSMNHVFSVALILLLTAIGAVGFRRAVERGGEAALVPPAALNVRNLFEILADAVMTVAAGLMGEKNARRFLPLIGTLAFFILFSNCLALIPGFAPPTATLKTNVALALTVFVLTHYYGVREHGLAYFKHFLGPVLWLAPLMLPVELISHFARPLSLSLRLLGNIFADHKVVASFFMLVPLLVPVPFMILGLLVAVVQTFIFCLLSMIYIQGAVAHEHDEEEKHS